MLEATVTRIVRWMSIPTSFSRIIAVVALALAAMMTAGCGSGDEGSPEYCASINSLRDSVNGLTDITIDQGALGELDTKLEEVRSDVKDVKEEAGDEFATEIDAMDEAASNLRTSLDAAAADPSLDTVSAVGTDIQTLVTSVKTLNDATKDKC